jgi:ASC-1-like (ASCH) protein
MTPLPSWRAHRREKCSPAKESKPTIHIAFPDDRHRIEEKRKRTYETFKSIMKKSPFNGEMRKA